jgi:hypothetical protein
MNNPIVDNKYLVLKRIAQSGFKMSNLTYVLIADLPENIRANTELIKVRGFIDSYELRQFHPLRSKDGAMILPLNTAVRKKIGKKEGDMVQVTLYLDHSPVVVPDELLVCLQDSPQARQFFMSLSESNQKYYIDWIEGSKKLETKAERISRTIQRLENGLKFYDWQKQP